MWHSAEQKSAFSVIKLSITFFIVLPSVIMPSVIIPSVVMPSVVMLSVITPSVVMLSVIMLSVNMPCEIMPSVIMLNIIVLGVNKPSVIMPIVAVLIVFMLCVHYTKSCFDQCCYFRAIGIFNEADTIESSSILIYSFQRQGSYTQRYSGKPYWLKQIIIKRDNWSDIFTINRGFFIKEENRKV